MQHSSLKFHINQGDTSSECAPLTLAPLLLLPFFLQTPCMSPHLSVCDFAALKAELQLEVEVWSTFLA